MKNNKVAIYARLSREDEDKIDGNKESRSIENQIKVLSDSLLPSILSSSSLDNLA